MAIVLEAKYTDNAGELVGKFFHVATSATIHALNFVHHAAKGVVGVARITFSVKRNVLNLVTSAQKIAPLSASMMPVQMDAWTCVLKVFATKIAMQG